MSDPHKYVIGIVGATGAVGVELIKCLEGRNFPVDDLRLFASAKSAGKVVDTFLGEKLIEEFEVPKARECHFVFLAVSGEFALEYAPKIVANNGPYVIDNSSAFRYISDIPLVVPEINARVLSKETRLVANPNCTTAIAVVVLWPLHKEFGIQRLIVSTYQAASGAGAEGMDELLEGTKTYLQGNPVASSVFVHPLPFNLIPHIDKFQENGYTKEEMKVVWETRKIFGISEEDIAISCTAVRIPSLRAHSESLTIETIKPINPDIARDILRGAPGVRVVDDPMNNLYPMPSLASAQYDVDVGRIRQSLVFGSCGLDLFVCGDQLLRGAALNAVLIAEEIIKLP